MKNRLRAFLGAFVALLFLGATSAQAVTWNSATDFLWNASTGKVDVFPGAGAGNVWATGSKAASATGPVWQEVKALPFNPSPTLNFKAAFSAKNILKGLFSPSNLLPIVMGPAIQALVGQACLQLAGGTMTMEPGGQWQECHFDTIQGTVYQGYFGSTASDSYYADMPTAAQAAVDKANAGVAGCTSSTVYGGQTYSTCAHYILQSVDVSAHSFQVQSCSAYCQRLGASGTSYGGGFNTQTQQEKVRNGWDNVDGPTAQAAAQATADQWTQADFLYGYDARAHQNLGEVLDNIMQSGNGVDLDPASVSATGPASLPGNPVTTTTQNPDGTTTTTTQNVTNNYNYGAPTTDNHITITNTQTTTTSSSVVNTTNNTTTTSTTTTTQTKDPTPDPCAGSNGTAGCAQLGTPPDAEKIPQQSVPVTFNPVSFAAPGGCPAPISYTMFNKAYTLSYQPMCDLMTTLCPLFLALGAAAAAWIFMEGLRA
jgi:hypothetical protein